MHILVIYTGLLWLRTLAGLWLRTIPRERFISRAGVLKQKTWTFDKIRWLGPLESLHLNFLCLFVHVFTSSPCPAKASWWHGPQTIVFHLKPAELPSWQLRNGLANHYFLRLRHEGNVAHELRTSGPCQIRSAAAAHKSWMSAMCGAWVRNFRPMPTI